MTTIVIIVLIKSQKTSVSLSNLHVGNYDYYKSKLYSFKQVLALIGLMYSILFSIELVFNKSSYQF